MRKALPWILTVAAVITAFGLFSRHVPEAPHVALSVRLVNQAYEAAKTGSVEGMPDVGLAAAQSLGELGKKAGPPRRWEILGHSSPMPGELRVRLRVKRGATWSEESVLLDADTKEGKPFARITALASISP